MEKINSKKKSFYVSSTLLPIIASAVLFFPPTIPAQYTDTVIQYGTSYETKLFVWGDSLSRNIAEEWKDMKTKEMVK